MFSASYYAEEAGRGVVDDVSSFHATERAEK